MSNCALLQIVVREVVQKGGVEIIIIIIIIKLTLFPIISLNPPSISPCFSESQSCKSISDNSSWSWGCCWCRWSFPCKNSIYLCCRVTIRSPVNRSPWKCSFFFIKKKRIIKKKKKKKKKNGWSKLKNKQIIFRNPLIFHTLLGNYQNQRLVEPEMCLMEAQAL